MTRTFYNDRIRKTQTTASRSTKIPAQPSCRRHLSPRRRYLGTKERAASKWQKHRVRTPASLEADLHS